MLIRLSLNAVRSRCMGIAFMCAVPPSTMIICHRRAGQSGCRAAQRDVPVPLRCTQRRRRTQLHSRDCLHYHHSYASRSRRLFGDLESLLPAGPGRKLLEMKLYRPVQVMCIRCCWVVIGVAVMDGCCIKFPLGMKMVAY